MLYWYANFNNLDWGLFLFDSAASSCRLIPPWHNTWIWNVPHRDFKLCLSREMAILSNVHLVEKTAGVTHWLTNKIYSLCFIHTAVLIHMIIYNSEQQSLKFNHNTIQNNNNNNKSRLITTLQNTHLHFTGSQLTGLLYCGIALYLPYAI